MNKYTLYFLLIFVYSTNLALSQSFQPHNLKLNLREGDSFAYTVESEKSFVYHPPREDYVLQSRSTRSKHWFYVEDIRPGNEYVIRYKELYWISENKSGDRINLTDSRFPPYNTAILNMIGSYLNTVEYKILFSPGANTMSISNMEDIRNDLLDYLVSRGQTSDEESTRAVDKMLDEKRILEGIWYLNFYPADNIDFHNQSWTHKPQKGQAETFTYIGEKDSTLILESVKPYQEHSEDNFVPGEKSKLSSRLIVHSETGLLLSAKISSFLQTDSSKTPTRSIFMNRSDITDYRSTIQLTEYSRWERPTILAGEINNPTAEKLCLVSQSSIVGSDKSYHFIELDQNGKFMERLDLTESNRYQLYYLENYPITRNKCIQLYIEPGDSIHFTASTPEITKSLNFSGIGYQNSKFLNEFYSMGGYGKYFGNMPVIYTPIIIQLHPGWKDSEDATQQISEFLDFNRMSLSEDFYNYMKYEILCVSMRDNLGKQIKYFRSYNKEGFKYQDMIDVFPDSLNPLQHYYTNMDQYRVFINEYSSFQFHLFKEIYTGKASNYVGFSDQYTFGKLLLSGYPLYVQVVNIIDQLLSRFSWNLELEMNGPVYQDIMSNCNNPDTRKYIQERYEAFTRIQPGNKLSDLNLTGVDGNIWDWDNSKKKVVVLMLYNDYTQEQFYCEDLYSEYGENKKDVIILRISPGYDFTSWKDFNEQYSDKSHQMYFADGIEAYKDRFFFSSKSYGSKYIVIDKNGNIYSNGSRDALERNIKEALEIRVTKKSFSQTIWARILPGMLLGMILTFILSRIIYNRRLAKHALEQKMAKLEQKAIKAQLNPHFLFNSLNSIQNLIGTDRKKDADRYLSKFAILIRQVLKNSDRDEISISEELKGLELYLELEQMRFDFEYEITSDEKLDIFNIMIPPMLLHPVVENAILHGLDGKEGDKKLIIGIQQSGDSIQFIIEDNGIGRDPEAIKNLTDEHRGLKLMETRMEVLRKSSREEFNFKITDKKDTNGNPAGTLVEILIPDER